MPRKPKVEKHQITVIVQGTPVAVILHPPKPPRRCWYAYWPGLTYSKSTGQRDLDEAIKVAENMLRNGGRQSRLEDTQLSDDEFEAVQREHYKRKQDPAARKRAEKSLGVCLDAIAAFREITGLQAVCLATADDCAAFQRKALRLPKSYRLTYPKARKDGANCYSADTVLKWSRALQAAFERVNVNSRRCVRGVVDKTRLLTANPWTCFDWIEGRKPAIRQFAPNELLSILDYLETSWQEVTVAALAAKVSLWSWARLSEVAGLRWDAFRAVGGEIHVEIVGKWGVEKWARIPSGLHQELLDSRCESPYVFAAYSEQLRRFYENGGRAKFAGNVRTQFNPEAFANWFQRRISAWAKATGHAHATPHVFRKTALQYARVGEDLNLRVASDARLTASVMLKHYVTERDEELRQASNRTYQRLLSSMPPDVACRYGHRAENGVAELEERLNTASLAKDWGLVADLAAELAKQHQPA